MVAINSTNPNVNVSPRKSTKEKTGKVAGAVVGGAIGLAMPAYTIKDTLQVLSPEGARKTASAMKMLMPDFDTFENTAKNVKQIMQETGLAEKGVKFHGIDNTSAESIKELTDVINANVGKKNWFNRRLAYNYTNMFSQGANAAYFPDTKDIVVCQQGLYTSAYHELGHAMNANGNIFTKTLQKARCLTPMGVSLVAPVVLAVGLLHKVDNTKPKEQKGKVERALDFVSNNAGKLTMASYVPLLAEEGLASIRGAKQAKKFLSPDMMKKLKGNYAKAWGTYALTAALISGGVALGIAICNGIKNKCAAKQQEAQAQETKQA